MSADKFFFEEDPEASAETKLNDTEHTNTFLTALEGAGMIKDRSGLMSFDPIAAASEADTRTTKNSILEIVHGFVKNDYVLHVTPTHPRKNLTRKELLDQAMLQTIVLLNKVVPTSLKVDIYKPRQDIEIKAVSYLIRDAAEAWNFDRGQVDQVVPEILEQVTRVCMLA